MGGTMTVSTVNATWLDGTPVRSARIDGCRAILTLADGRRVYVSR
jgi:hypothetical protein